MNRFFFTLLVFSFQAWADPALLTEEFKELVSEHKIGKLKDQSFCYDNGTEIEGFQANKVQRIASLTKLFTTYLASETMDLHQKYITRIYIGKDRLHIAGGRDPYFEEDKLLLLFKALNELGFHSFKKISFDRNFLFYDIALGRYERITPEKTRSRLALYLNSRRANYRNYKWDSVVKFAEEEGVFLDPIAPALTASQVFISDRSPLNETNSIVYFHQSKPLHSLLKTMNVQSKNYVAENIYSAAFAIKSFSKLMKEKKISSGSYRIYTGSGLPIISKQGRVDNMATCELVLKIISLLSESLLQHNLSLSDVMAVSGGKDLGSLRERFLDYPHLAEAALAKTGTLKHTSSFAGMLLINNQVPFAILNHSTKSAVSRKFQDEFVDRMFNHLGPATPMIYNKISIFPWDSSNFLEPLI